MKNDKNNRDAIVDHWKYLWTDCCILVHVQMRHEHHPVFTLNILEKRNDGKKIMKKYTGIVYS